MELHANFLELNMLSQIRALPNPAYKHPSGLSPHPLVLHLSPTSTANVMVTSLSPVPNQDKPFVKISSSPEVIVAPKTRAKTTPGVAKEGKSEHSVDGRSAASTSRTRSRKQEAPPPRQAVFLRGVSRQACVDWFEEEEEIDKDAGLKIWVDWSVLTAKQLRGVTWVSVSVVRPTGLQAPIDPQQQQEQELAKPASRVVAQVCPWEEAPDSKHVALSTSLCSVLQVTSNVGETIRVEAAASQAARQSIRTLKISPFPNPGAISKSGFQFGSKSKADREEAARRILSNLGKNSQSRLLEGPITDGMILPSFEDSATGTTWPGGILQMEPTSEQQGLPKNVRAWFLGSDRKMIAKLGSNDGETAASSKLELEIMPDPVKTPNAAERWSLGQALPQKSPVLVGIDALTEQVRNNVIYGSSVLLTGGRGSGKSALAQVVAHKLGLSAFYHATLFPCTSLQTDETRISSIKETLNRIYGLAAWGARNGGHSLIVLDDIDAVCPAETELQTSDNGRSRQVSELIIAMTKQYCTMNSRVVVIATAKSKEDVNNIIIGGHVVREIINMPAPDKQTRRDILEELCAGHSHLTNGTAEGLDEASSWMDGPDSGDTSDSEGHARSTNNNHQSEKEAGFVVDPSIDFLDIAGQSDGFMPGDLLLLTSRARSEAIIRSTSDSSAISDSMSLTAQDFAAALKGFTPSSLRNVTLQHSTTTFSSIGGLTATRQTLLETLQYPTLYAPIFAKCPLRLRSGLLLYGYPGCGKTLLASAVAGECGLNFISVKGPEILNKYIGASEKSVRDLFERAQAARPCVLFFDEFDSVAPKRGHDSTGVTDRVVNQLLTQMDGAEGLSGVYVLAATSRPDLIDPALLRPGRLDKSLLCDMPNFDDRIDILKALSGKLKIDPSLLNNSTGSKSGKGKAAASAPPQNMDEIARRTEGYSGADLQAVVYNAHLEAIHDVLDKRDDKSMKGPRSGKTDNSQVSKNIPDFTYFRFGKDGEGVDTAPLSAAAKAAERAKIAEMLAAHKMAQQRAKAERKAALYGTSGQDDRKNGRQEDKDKENQEPVIEWKHIERSLDTTRPSISRDERNRLNRIYREFVVGRNGEMPSGQGGSEIGGRSSLM